MPKIGVKSKQASKLSRRTKSAGSGGLLASTTGFFSNFPRVMLVVGAVAIVGASYVVMTFAGTSSYSLFAAGDKPGEIATWDTTPVELGMRFKASAAGTVTGVRFYKGSRNTGTHLGRLWDTQGRKLAEAKFGAETASGWQQVSFAKPVALVVGQEYVVSYYAPKGNYGMTAGYFAGKAKTTKALTAPASTKSKRNGVSRYGAGYPTGSYQSSNYWVDVVFQPIGIINPTPKPTVLPSVTPVPTATATPNPTPKPTPVPAAASLFEARKKDIAMQLVSSAENSSLDWRAQYGYIEDIKDGRGYTAGIIGFCSGTGDMLELVKYYNSVKPGNVLQKYTAALQAIDDKGFAAAGSSHAGLDPNFTKDWKLAATDTVFQAAQDHERDRLYFNPAVNLAIQDGLPALGQFAYYDAAVVHGFDGAKAVRARAMKKAKTPALGGSASAYISAYLDERNVEMLKEEAHSDLSRIETAQRVFLKAGNLNLDPPLSWKTYGDSYSIPR